jgi:hypothetical protein
LVVSNDCFLRYQLIPILSCQCLGNPDVELTDGWYSIPAELDVPLLESVKNGKIFVGLKLLFMGAKLTQGEACPPLEAPSHIKLALNANSTRRARWHTRLGFRRLPHLAISLSSIQPEGGAVSALDVIVTRKYDILYMEKLPDGGVAWRNQHEEDLAAKLHQVRGLVFSRDHRPPLHFLIWFCSMPKHRKSTMWQSCRSGWKWSGIRANF